jgi:hypothetical protein
LPSQSRWAKCYGVGQSALDCAAARRKVSNKGKIAPAAQ